MNELYRSSGVTRQCLLDARLVGSVVLSFLGLDRVAQRSVVWQLVSTGGGHRGAVVAHLSFFAIHRLLGVVLRLLRISRACSLGFGRRPAPGVPWLVRRRPVRLLTLDFAEVHLRNARWCCNLKSSSAWGEFTDDLLKN